MQFTEWLMALLEGINKALKVSISGKKVTGTYWHIMPGIGMFKMTECHRCSSVNVGIDNDTFYARLDIEMSISDEEGTMKLTCRCPVCEAKLVRKNEIQLKLFENEVNEW